MRRLTALLASLLLLVPGVAACSGAVTGDGAVVVLGPWLDDPGSTTDESDVFQALLRDYGRRTGVTITYQGTRAIGQALRAKVKDGTLPDIAIMPAVGELAAYATEDLAQPVTDLVRRSAPSPVALDHRALWRGGTAYAVAVKTDLKSLILYDEEPPAATSWTALLADAGKRGPRPWCLGLGAASSPGWPGTDWIEDLLLHRSGAGAYEEWASGRTPWTAPAVREAWTAWGSVIRSSTANALLTSPAQAAQAFARGDCSLLHQSSFFAGGRGAFVPFPPGGDLEVSGDFAALFSTDPAARALLTHLTGAGGAEWARSGVFPLDPDPSAYGDLGRRVALQLTGAGRRCLDASDAMPAPMAAAFQHAVLEFAADQTRLDPILTRLDTVRAAVAKEDWVPLRCAP